MTTETVAAAAPRRAAPSKENSHAFTVQRLIGRLGGGRRPAGRAGRQAVRPGVSVRRFLAAAPLLPRAARKPATGGPDQDRGQRQGRQGRRPGDLHRPARFRQRRRGREHGPGGRQGAPLHPEGRGRQLRRRGVPAAGRQRPPRGPATARLLRAARPVRPGHSEPRGETGPGARGRTGALPEGRGRQRPGETRPPAGRHHERLQGPVGGLRRRGGAAGHRPHGGGGQGRGPHGQGRRLRQAGRAVRAGGQKAGRRARRGGAPAQHEGRAGRALRRKGERVAQGLRLG